MKNTLLVICILFPSSALAQDETIKNMQAEASKGITKDPNDTINKIWKTGGVFSLNLAQGSLSNWSAGGEKFSIALNSLLNVYAFYKKDKHSWDNVFTWNIGYVKTTSLGTRKNDDRV